METVNHHFWFQRFLRAWIFSNLFGSRSSSAKAEGGFHVSGSCPTATAAASGADGLR